MALFTVQGPRALPGGGATFPSLPGLLGRWRADVGVTLSGSDVTAVADQSGNGNNLTNSGTVPWSATGYIGSLGSKPAFVFAAANSAALFKSSFPIGTGKPASMFMIGQMTTSTDNFGGGCSYGVGANNDNSYAGAAIFLVRDGTNAAISAYRNTSSTTQSMTTGANHRMGSIFIDATSTIQPYVDNVAAGAPNTWSGSAFENNGTIVIGNRWQSGIGGGAWDGAICEIFIGNADWTANLADIDNYLTQQWGS